MNWYKKAQTYREIMENPGEYSMPGDPGYFNAYRYFSIGQDEENPGYCWIYDKGRIRVKKGGTHNTNFPSVCPNIEKFNGYRGWYDPDQNLISVILPMVKGEPSPSLIPSSLPVELRASLSENFGTDNEIIVF